MYTVRPVTLTMEATQALCSPLLDGYGERGSKKSILRSIGLGLGAAWSCQRFPDGLCWPSTSSADRVRGSAAGPLRVCSESAWPWPVLLCIAPGVGCMLYTTVWCCKGKSCQRGKGAPPFTRASPGTVWQCLIDPRIWSMGGQCWFGEEDVWDQLNKTQWNELGGMNHSTNSSGSSRLFHWRSHLTRAAPVTNVDLSSCHAPWNVSRPRSWVRIRPPCSLVAVELGVG